MFFRLYIKKIGEAATLFEGQYKIPDKRACENIDPKKVHFVILTSVHFYVWRVFQYILLINSCIIQAVCFEIKCLEMGL